LLGKLTVTRVECSKRGRFGRYPLHRLIDQHGGNGTILDWLLPAQAQRQHQRPMPRAVPRFAQGAVEAC
jgi:hypothetical protein